MGAKGPENKYETDPKNIEKLLTTIKDAEVEFNIALKHYEKLTNQRLKDMAQEKLNLLLISIMKYAVEGMPKDYIKPYPEWVRQNQEKIQGWLQNNALLGSTVTEINELNSRVMNPGAAPEPPRPRAAPEPDAYRARQQAREQAQREQAQREQAQREQAQREQAQREQAQREQAEREQAEREHVQREREQNPELKAAFESVINDPEQVLKDYKKTLGLGGRLSGKMKAEGKDARADIEKIVKVFQILKADQDPNWFEKAKAAYCYLEKVYRKYDVGYYGSGYQIKHQHPAASVCQNYKNDLNKIFGVNLYDAPQDVLRELDRYVGLMEDKIQRHDQEKTNRPKR